MQDWLAYNFRLLSKLQFTPTAHERLWSERIRFLPMAAATNTEFDSWTIVIPDDVTAPLIPEGIKELPYNDTKLTTWNPITRPGDAWEIWPRQGHGLFWRSTKMRALMPTWNIYGTAKDLLAFREEREIAIRDRHGRFPMEASPRYCKGLTTVPFVNEALAALLMAINAIDSNFMTEPWLFPGDIAPVSLTLSHDCDCLFGADVVTQAVRCLKFMRPLARFGPPDFTALWAVAENALHPKRYYFDNMFGMFDLEREFGMRSVSYILSGTGGRFGARTPARINRHFCRSVPDGWPIGIHYNYNTVGDYEKFSSQLKQVRRWVDAPIESGRAHYVRFDATKDFEFLEKHGIRYDESVGWTEASSYRCGIAGPFMPLTSEGALSANVIEMPLTMMDTTIPAAPERPGSFSSLFSHLQRVGGVLSVLVHPGVFHNPEIRRFYGVYWQILSSTYHSGGRSLLPVDILDCAKSLDGLNPAGKILMAS